jgi:hypothetical protein
MLVLLVERLLQLPMVEVQVLCISCRLQRPITPRKCIVVVVAVVH